MKRRLMIDFSISILLLCASASGHIVRWDYDLTASAAEPRPIIAEMPEERPQEAAIAQALPLVSVEDAGAEASEKVEKILQPAISFAYNAEHDDSKPAETKEVDQRPEAVDYYRHVEEEKTKSEDAPAVKGETGEAVAEEKGEQTAESSHHHGQKHGGGGGGGKFEKGGGKEHHAEHEGEHGAKGDKGYKGHHHHEKGAKGHHDKEEHNKSYGEKGGHQKENHHEDGYHGEHQKAYGGKKEGDYSEKGEHNKGHSTKGSHSIHKKDEYEKKTEFFEEDHESGETEKHGGYSHKNSYDKGGHHKGGHKKGGHHQDYHGKKSDSSKGGHYHEDKGHSDKKGHDVHHEHIVKHGEKDNSSKGKKWAFKKGTGDDGGGKGHEGHGAHSHKTYAVEKPPVEPPKKEVAAEAAPVGSYDLPPIPTLVLPLEGEEEARETPAKEAKMVKKRRKVRKEKVKKLLEEDVKFEPSEYVYPKEFDGGQGKNVETRDIKHETYYGANINTFSTEKPTKKSFKPSNEDRFLTDYLLNALLATTQMEGGTTAPTIETQETFVNDDLEKKSKSKKMKKKRKIGKGKDKKNIELDEESAYQDQATINENLNGPEATTTDAASENVKEDKQTEEVVKSGASHSHGDSDSFVIVAADKTIK